MRLAIANCLRARIDCSSGTGVVPALKRGLGAARSVLKDAWAESPSGPTAARRAAPSRGFSPGTAYGDERRGLGPGTAYGDERRGLGPGTAYGDERRGLRPGTAYEDERRGLGPATAREVGAR